MQEESTGALALPDAVLASLGPEGLPYYRSVRSRGQERAIELRDLVKDDRRCVLRAYELLGQLEQLDASEAGVDASKLHEVSVELEHLLRALGTHERYEAGAPARLVLHDVRGGAAVALLSSLGSRTIVGRAVRLLARDHRKLMRNGLRDLDPERQQQDVAMRLHSSAQLLAALRESPRLNGLQHMEIDCRFEGPVTASCTELGALERILYNMVNNASCYASPRFVRLWLLPVRGEQGRDLRLVTANGIDLGHEAELRAQTGTRTGELFSAGVSTSGSGAGLHICAQLVADAYGIPGPDEVVRAGYVGAKLLNHQFVAWCTWPAIRGMDAIG